MIARMKLLEIAQGNRFRDQFLRLVRKHIIEKTVLAADGQIEHLITDHDPDTAFGFICTPIVNKWKILNRKIGLRMISGFYPACKVCIVRFVDFESHII